jgi:hypothetical protein
MAEYWYVLKVRSGFEKAVVRRLRRQGLEVFASEDKIVRTPLHPSINPGDYIYCRFAPEAKQAITAVPGVLDVIERVANPLKK